MTTITAENASVNLIDYMNGVPYYAACCPAGCYGFASPSSFNVPANFPKGYNTFYCMKYEISQGQYADYLNTISTTAASVRSTTAHNGVNRHTISISGSQYVAARPDRACNFLSAIDVLSYLDWAALRPMSELEFEKICNGFGTFISTSFAWGNTTQIEGINLSGPETGAETITDANANLHFAGSNNAILGGDGGQGPIGCGIFARDATQTRETTGGSYWGVMEMSGNVHELVMPITLSGVWPAASPLYTGQWGDGNIDNATGIHNVASWVTPTQLWVNSTQENFPYIKGGAWDSPVDRTRVLDRTFLYSTSAYNPTTRYASTGGRGVR